MVLRLAASIIMIMVAVILMAVSVWAAEKSSSRDRSITADIQNEVVARVGDRVITLKEFNQIMQRGNQKPDQKLLPLHKKAYLERLVQSILIYEEAKRLRLQEHPEVSAKIEDAISQVLVAEYIRLFVVDKIKVEESEVKAYWESRPQEFTTPLQVRARHLLVAVSGSADSENRAFKRAQDILSRIQAGEDFAMLATELSEDIATKEKGGDLGYFVKGKMSPEFEAAAFAAKVGEVVGPVRTTFGYHLIKVEDIREPILRPFEVVRQSIHSRLVRDRQQSLMDALLKGIKDRIPTETNLGLFDLED